MPARLASKTGSNFAPGAGSSGAFVFFGGSSLEQRNISISSTPPNHDARTQLDRGLDSAKKCLLACASGNEQDVVGLQFHIGRLAAEYALEVDGNLLAFAGRLARTKDLGRGRSGRRLQPFRQ